MATGWATEKPVATICLLVALVRLVFNPDYNDFAILWVDDLAGTPMAKPFGKNHLFIKMI